MALQVTSRGIEVMQVGREAVEDWNEHLERSPQGTVFHRSEFLAVAADHADATLHRLVGYKGAEPVGLFPVFELTRGYVSTAFSPPPNLGLAALGPVVLGLDDLKPRSAGKRTRRFTSACLEWIAEHVDPSFVHLQTVPEYPDTRPLVWNDFDVNPRYTYVLDLSPSPREILQAASADARRNVRNTDQEAYEIRQGDATDLPAVIDHLERRHEEQGIDYAISTEYVVDLHDALPDGALRTYVCEVAGRYASGMITLEDDRSIYRWQGGAKPTRDVDVPANDLLDWRAIRGGVNRGLSRYDLHGANTPKLCEYKSKFGPDLVTYHCAEKGTRAMRLLSNLYRSIDKVPIDGDGLL